MRLGFDSVEAFEHGYARFVTHKGLFLASKSPRPVGTALRFELQTRGGEGLVLAEGRVVGVRREDPDEPRRVPGMHVRFTRLTQESRERIARMAAPPPSEEPEPEPEPGAEPEEGGPDGVDPDALPAPPPAPITGDEPEPTPEPEEPSEPPLELPDASSSPFRDVFARLFGMGGGAPPAEDPFEAATVADLPPTDGEPLEDVPELPPDALLPPG